MTKEIAIAKTNDIAIRIDEIVGESHSIISKKATTFLESLCIARAVHELKGIMLNSPEIERVVMSMSNNRLGFLTDRTPAILRANVSKGKYPQKEYSYQELVDPIIEALLNGYRLTGNEFNIISGQFYSTKNGNSRHILEHPDISNFSYNNSPVELVNGGSTARVKCWAKWRQHGETVSIGIDAEDELIIQVRVNAFMGEDAVIGKAHSKLFKRVLERITGRITPEASDVDTVIDIPIVSNAKAKRVEDRPQMPILQKKEDQWQLTNIDGDGIGEIFNPTTPPPPQQPNREKNPIANGDNRPPDGINLDGDPIQQQPQKAPQVFQQRPPHAAQKTLTIKKLVDDYVEDVVAAACKRIGTPYPPRDPNNQSILKTIEAECEKIINESGELENGF